MEVPYAPLEIAFFSCYFYFRSGSRDFALRVSVCLPAMGQVNGSA
jgi:hypothetical protein